MIPLSRAIRQGASDDPLEAALDSLRCGFLSTASAESRPTMALQALYEAWPQLGASIRVVAPQLANQLPPGLVSPYARGGTGYRREVHVTLFRCITDLHEHFAHTKDQIADLLAGVRL